LHIGQGERCQLQLPDPVLARETLELVHDVEGVLVKTASGEATLQLAGQRWKARRLRDRDELSIGATRLLFEEPAQGAIDALKNAADEPLAGADAEAAAAALIERTQTAPEMRSSFAPRPQPSAAKAFGSSGSSGSSLAPEPASSSRGGPSLAELVIYALAIAVLLASGLALLLLLRAR
jgi:hypothetical protein